MAKHEMDRYSQAQHQSGRKSKILKGARRLLFGRGEYHVECDTHGFATEVLSRYGCNQTVVECSH